MNDKAREAFEREYEAYCAPAEADWFRREEDDPDEYYHLTTKEAWWGFRAALQWAASQQPDAKAWAVLNEHGDVSMAFLDRAEALTYCGEGEQPVPMVFGGAASQQAAEGWISVHERLPALPEDCEDDGVKVYTWDGEFVTEDVFEPQYEQPAGPAVGGWLRTGDWFCSDTASRVTHWMPRKLPAAPTAQGERE